MKPIIIDLPDNEASYILSIDPCLYLNLNSSHKAARFMNTHIWPSGNGQTIESLLGCYFQEKCPKMDIVSMPKNFTEYDFMIWGKPVETRRTGRDGNSDTLYFGYTNGKKKVEVNWQVKARNLQKLDGGYIGVLVKPEIWDLYWFPAKLIMKHFGKYKGGTVAFNVLLRTFNLVD